MRLKLRQRPQPISIVSFKLLILWSTSWVNLKPITVRGPKKFEQRLANSSLGIWPNGSSKKPTEKRWEEAKPVLTRLPRGHADAECLLLPPRKRHPRPCWWRDHRRVRD